MDYDDSKIDDDLDKLLQHIKEEQQNSMVLVIYNFYKILFSYLTLFLTILRMHQILQKLNHLLVHQLEGWNRMIHQQTLMIIYINVDHLDICYMQLIFLYHW